MIMVLKLIKKLGQLFDIERVISGEGVGNSLA
jgi:hypothetical protein